MEKPASANLPLTWERRECGSAYVLLRRTRVPLDVRRGPGMPGAPPGVPVNGRIGGTLGESLDASAEDLRRLCDAGEFRRAPFDGAPPEAPLTSLRDVVFLDTETTGLVGGAGTHVFLLGCASFIRAEAALPPDGPAAPPDHLEVRQWLLPDPKEESALLDVLAEEARAAQGVITFNGRTFDLPLLEERCLLARRRSPLEGVPHLDLLVGARRVLKLRAGRASLRTLEERILGVTRLDDLPGAECPAAWFAFVKGDPRPMERVLEHNLLDLLSLPPLTAALARAARGRAPAPDVYAAGRVLARTGEEARATDLHRTAAATASEGPLASLAHAEASRLLRRAGRPEDAAAEAEAATRRDPGNPVPWIALAKHHEHATGDLDRALACARRAEKALFLRGRGAGARREAAARIARLEGKLAARGAGSAPSGDVAGGPSSLPRDTPRESPTPPTP